MVLEKIKGGLIVSCQALENEPLYSSYIMGRMAVAAKLGGAVGIRSNSKSDILEIRKVVDLPIIGIVKRDYSDSNVFITATMKEIHELAESGCDIIALDATSRKRPKNESLSNYIEKIRNHYPSIKLMADISTLEEAVIAENLGFDCISTTLMGYTEESRQDDIEANDFEKLKEIIKVVTIPVIAEGNINTPEKAARCQKLGVYSIVVGSAITRPQLITAEFVKKIKEA